MANEILKDKRGIKYGKISTDPRGNATIFDKLDRKLGSIKTDAAGNHVAYDKTNNKMAVYDPRNDITKNKIGNRVAKGNVLVDLFFGSK